MNPFNQSFKLTSKSLIFQKNNLLKHDPIIRSITQQPPFEAITNSPDHQKPSRVECYVEGANR